MSRLLGFSCHGSLLRFSPSRGSTPSPFCSFDDVDACHAWLRRLFVHLCPTNYRWFYEKMSRRKKVYADFGEREKELSNYRNQNILREQEKKAHLWKTYLALTKRSIKEGAPSI